MTLSVYNVLGTIAEKLPSRKAIRLEATLKVGVGSIKRSQSILDAFTPLFLFYVSLYCRRWFVLLWKSCTMYSMKQWLIFWARLVWCEIIVISWVWEILHSCKINYCCTRTGLHATLRDSFVVRRKVVKFEYSILILQNLVATLDASILYKIAVMVATSERIDVSRSRFTLKNIFNSNSTLKLCELEKINVLWIVFNKF